MELNQYQKEIEKLLILEEKRVNRAVFDLYVTTVKDIKRSLLLEYRAVEKLSRSQRMDLLRMQALLDTIESRSQVLEKGLGVVIPDYLKRSGELAYNGLFYEYESTRGRLDFALLNEEALKTIIETPVAGFRLSERLEGNVEDLRNNINNELTRSFLHGDSYQKAAKRLSIVGMASYHRAMRIVRTEGGRVSAVSRQRSQTYAQELGVEFEKVWMAVLDKKTRHNHGQLDGQRVAPDEYFTSPSGKKALQPHMFGVASEDINCRCRTISRLKGDDTPLLRRDNETGEVGEWKNYQEWEKARGYEVKKSKSLEKATDKVYNQGMSNLDLMAKQRSFTVGNDIRVKTKKLNGTDFDFWAQDNTKKIRDTIFNVQSSLKELNDYPTPTVVFLKKSRLPGFAGYDYKQDILFVSDVLHSEIEFSKVLSDNYFAAQNIKDTMVHELTHKKHWDSAKAFYKANKKRYNNVEQAMSELNSPLVSYVKEQLKHDYNYLYNISDNAAIAFYNDNINELVAEVGVLGDKVTDPNLLNKVKEVLSWK